MQAPPSGPDITRSALIIVDMQNDFLHPDGSFGRMAAAHPEFYIDMRFLMGTIPHVKRLADAFRVFADVKTADEVLAMLGRQRPWRPGVPTPATSRINKWISPRSGIKWEVSMKELHQVREGQIVRVTDGPFAGFLGEVTAVDEQIVNVDVHVYGRSTPVVLAFGGVELVQNLSN